MSDFYDSTADDRAAEAEARMWDDRADYEVEVSRLMDERERDDETMGRWDR